MPSNPNTPSRPPNSSTTAITTTVTTSTASVAQVQAGMEGLQMTSGVPTDLPPPTLPSSLTPAPVTVVRTPRPHPPLAEQLPGAGGALSDQFSGSTGSAVPPPQSTSVLLPSGDEITSQQQQQLNISGHQQHQQSQQPNTATVYRMTNAEFSATTQAPVPNAIAPQYSGQPEIPQQHSGGILTNATPAVSTVPTVSPLSTPLPASMHPPTPAAGSAVGLASSSIPTATFPPVTSNYGVAHASSGSITSVTHPSIPAATAAVPFSSTNAAVSLPVQGLQGGAYPGPPAVSQTVSGLPVLPPSISFPSVAPKISLTPTTFQTTPTTTAS